MKRFLIFTFGFSLIKMGSSPWNIKATVINGQVLAGLRFGAQSILLKPGRSNCNYNRKCRVFYASRFDFRLVSWANSQPQSETKQSKGLLCKHNRPNDQKRSIMLDLVCWLEMKLVKTHIFAFVNRIFPPTTKFPSTKQKERSNLRHDSNTKYQVERHFGR
jgi:hypothetical protein